MRPHGRLVDREFADISFLLSQPPHFLALCLCHLGAILSHFGFVSDSLGSIWSRRGFISDHLGSILALQAWADSVVPSLTSALSKIPLSAKVGKTSPY